MEVIIQPDPAQATAVATKIIARLIAGRPDAVLGLATGGTPVQLYRSLIEQDLDWSRITTFNLDEYVGVAPEHPQSYHAFMEKNLFRHVNIRPQHTHIPDGMAHDIPAMCLSYEKKISDADGIDLQLLGIGSDGHIGFNEPSSSLASRTRIKTLTPLTRRDNARFFGNEEAVPFHVVTMGIGTIMEARHCLLLAFGENKADAIASAVEGPVAASNPASILQMHQTATLCIDEAAASKLQRASYYRWVFENKPAWQRL
ncbi:MAG: glucosamine-6-phosphate deaminase [Terrimicrobiaceae bacterium]